MTRSNKTVLLIFCAVTYLTALFFTVYLVYLHTMHSLTQLAWSPYGYSDLLINYSAGFLRRGLIGAAIHRYAGNGFALPVTDVLVFTNFCALTAAIVLLTLFANVRNRLLNALLILVIPGGIFAWAISDEFFYRKEVFFFSTLAVIGLAVSLSRRLTHPRLRRTLAIILTISIFASGIVLSFVHEAFIFLAAPANLFLLFALGRRLASEDRESNIPAIQRRLFLLYYGMLTTLFLVSFVFRGTPATANRIWRGLNPQDQLMINPNGTIEGALRAMQFGLLKLLGMPAHIFAYGMGWYWLVPVICLMLYCFSILAINTQENSAQSLRDFKRWVVVYLSVFAGAIPVFLLGWDWGRWVASINLTFLILSLSIVPADLPDWLIAFPQKWPVRASQAAMLAERFVGFVQRRRLRIAIVLLLFALTFRLPEGALEPLHSGYITHDIFHGLKIDLRNGLRPLIHSAE